MLLREKVNWRLKVARLLLLSADKGKIKSQIYPLKKKNVERLIKKAIYARNYL